MGLVVAVARLHRPFLMASAASTLVLTVIAAGFGSAFLATHFNAIYSFLMAVFFLGAWRGVIRLQACLRFATRNVPLSRGPPSEPSEFRAIGSFVEGRRQGFPTAALAARSLGDGGARAVPMR